MTLRSDERRQAAYVEEKPQTDALHRLREKWQRAAAGEVVLEAEQTYQECIDDLDAVLATVQGAGPEPPNFQSHQVFKLALERIRALDLKKDEQGRDDFYSGPDRFFQAWNIANDALRQVEALASPLRAAAEGKDAK